MINIAIIGAGLAGLTAAHRLKRCAEVTLFEKSRGVSGRLSTRRADPYAFDHGAQFFKVRSNAFRACIDPMLREGTVQRWDARFVEIDGTTIVKRRQWDEEFPHYVGVPGMSAIGKHLSQDLDIRLDTRVLSAQRTRDRWTLLNDQGISLGTYDWVISSVPARQAFDLLPPSLPFHSALSAPHMRGCFALMLGFDCPVSVEFDAALVRGRDISWISLNSSKPGRNRACCLLVHSTNEWADEHIEGDREWAMDYLCAQTSDVIGLDVGKAPHKALHAWRFANIERQAGPTHFISPDQQVGACGDWLIQGRVEAAFTSGLAMADSLLETL